MALDPDAVAKPFSKLRKSLKKISKQPSPDEVHDLRTRTRRVEAALHALLLDNKKKGKRVLRAVTPLRRRAGKVRDMDVLIGLMSGLGKEAEDACRLQLLEQLTQRRLSGARKLRKTTAKHRRAARRLLKRCSSSIEKNANNAKGKLEWPADAAAIALQLSNEIQNWPKLNARNLHPFRKKLKELRYVLELSGGEEKLADALKDVSDAVGEWHNWLELEAIAKESLQHSGPCNLLQELTIRTHNRLKEALAGADQVREKYFSAEARPGNRHKGATTKSVLNATAKLAA